MKNKKIEYPRKFKGQFALVKIPVLTTDRGYLCSLLEKDGTTTESGFAGHQTEDSCWICCMAHNQRFGYSRKEVDKIFKQLTNEGKNSKGKKDKKVSDSKVKGDSKKVKGKAGRKKAEGKSSKGKKDKKSKGKNS